MKTIALHEILNHSEPVMVEYMDMLVPVHFRRGTSDQLVAIFHGAIVFARRSVPVFTPFIDAIYDAHQISISDPTMLDPRWPG